MTPEQPENPQATSGTSADSPPPGSGGGAEPPGHAAAARPGDEIAGRVLALVRHLRAGCPWDARQTPDSLRPYLLEEAHETADAVLSGDDEALAGELGDLLLNVAFQIVLAEEREAFDVRDVVHRLEEKMVRRHPHVYGDAEEPPDWEEMKAGERAGAPSGGGDGPFAGLPSELEPLGRALRVQQRAAALGFDWPDVRGAVGKLREEIREVEELAADGSPAPPEDAGAPEAPGGTAGRARAGGTVPDEALEDELGDLLFAAVNVSRLAAVHPTRALEGATRKFEARFRQLVRRARERGLDLEEASLEEMEALWGEVKADGG